MDDFYSGRSKKIILILILITGFVLRSFNLLFDQDYFFNPDERNMAASISQLRLPKTLPDALSCIRNEFNLKTAGKINIQDNDGKKPCNLNPHFFAYGQLPLYSSFLLSQAGYFFTGQTNELPYFQTAFPDAILWLRIISVFSSVLTILFIYKSVRLISKYEMAALSAAIFTAFSPGLIQSAHFGTTESLLAFFLSLSLFLGLKIFKTFKESARIISLTSLRFVVFASAVNGLAMGTKLTGLFTFVPTGLAYLFFTVGLFGRKNKNAGFSALQCLYLGVLSVCLSLVFYALSSPFNFVEEPNFTGAVFGYEKDVATGIYKAFYTRQFEETLPFIFQHERIYPYALGWPVYLSAVAGIFYVSCKTGKQLILSFILSFRKILKIKFRQKKSPKRPDSLVPILLTVLTLVSVIVPNSLLYAKWTRFIIPAFPLFCIIAAIFIHKIQVRLYLLLKNTSLSSLANAFTLIFTVISVIPGISFMSIYTNKDTRFESSLWIYDNIPNGSYILSETANVIDIPLGIKEVPDKNYTVVSFDFYHLDLNPSLFPELISHLERADYVFIPSRRLFENHLRLPDKFPLLNRYYRLLFSGKLGFQEVKKVSSFPSLRLPYFDFTLMEFPDEKAEETFTVFDHPVVRIYQKTEDINYDKFINLFLSDKL